MSTPRAQLPTLRAFLGAVACFKSSTTSRRGLALLEGGLTQSDSDVRDVVNAAVQAIVTVSVADFGAVGDGVNDDTQAFIDAITTVAGGGTVLIPAGTYRITRTINVNTPGVKLKGDGRDLSIIRADSLNLNVAAGQPSHHDCLFEEQASGVDYEDLFFQGAATSDTTAQYAVTTFTTSGFLQGTGQNFAAITNETLSLTIDGVAVSVTFATDTTLEAVIKRINGACELVNPDFNDTAVYALDGVNLGLLSPSCGPSSTIAVTGGTAMTKLGLTVTSNSGQYSNAPKRVSFRRCHFGGVSRTQGLNNGISWVQGCDDWTVENCTFELIGASGTFGSGYGMNIGGRRFRVLDCKMLGDSHGGRHLVYIGGGARDGLVRGDQVYGAQSNSLNSGSFPDYGQRPCRNNRFESNTLVQQLHTGGNNAAISVNGGQKGTVVTGNTIVDCGDYGIYCSGFSAPENGLSTPGSVEITGNTILRSGQHAIFLQNVFGAKVHNNAMEDCGTSVYAGWASIMVSSYGPSSSARCHRISVRGNRVTTRNASLYLHKVAVEFESSTAANMAVDCECFDNTCDAGGIGDGTLLFDDSVNALRRGGTVVHGSYNPTIKHTRELKGQAYVDGSGNFVIENASGTNLATWTATEFVPSKGIRFAGAFASPYITHDPVAGAATAFTVSSQSSTGSTGGDYVIDVGTGPGGNGQFKVSVNSANALAMGDTFFQIAQPLTAPSGQSPRFGQVTLSLVDADHNLSASEEACFLIIVTGTWTGDHSVFAPLNAKACYHVVNATTGGHNVLFGGSSGSKVTIAAGSAKVCQSDGTNYYG